MIELISSFFFSNLNTIILIIIPKIIGKRRKFDLNDEIENCNTKSHFVTKFNINSTISNMTLFLKISFLRYFLYCLATCPMYIESDIDHKDKNSK